MAQFASTNKNITEVCQKVLYGVHPAKIIQLARMQQVHVSPAMTRTTRFFGWTALLATMVWHLRQYALAAGMSEDMIKAVTGWGPASFAARTATLVGIGLAVLTLSTAFVWTYSSGRKGARIYERILKGLVWMIIVAFLVVIVRRSIDGGMQWAKLFKGFLPLYIPTDARGVSIVMAAFSAATGINATFLFPYTLLGQGWGREHRHACLDSRYVGQYSLLSGFTDIVTAFSCQLPEEKGQAAD